MAIMPMAMLVGTQLPMRLKLPFVLIVAFCLGVLVTYAEPAIAAIRWGTAAAQCGYVRFAERGGCLETAAAVRAMILQLCAHKPAHAAACKLLSVWERGVTAFAHAAQRARPQKRACAGRYARRAAGIAACVREGAACSARSDLSPAFAPLCSHVLLLCRPLAALVDPSSAPYLYFVMNQKQELMVSAKIEISFLLRGGGGCCNWILSLLGGTVNISVDELCHWQFLHCTHSNCHKQIKGSGVMNLQQ